MSNRLLSAILIVTLATYIFPIRADEPKTPPLFTEEELKAGIDLGELVRRLPPDQQKEYCNNLFDAGLTFDFPECWRCVDNPQAVLKAVYSHPEPLSEASIDALQRLFPKLLTHQDRIKAGSLLYRYRRTAGRDYLVGRLKERLDNEAAMTLAQERDLSLLPYLLQTLRKYHQPGLAMALGPWKHPEIAGALVQEAKAAIKQRSTGYALFADALADQGVPEAAPTVHRLYTEAETGNPLKLEMAALLVRLRTGQSKEARAFLLDQLTLPARKVRPKVDSRTGAAFKESVANAPEKAPSPTEGMAMPFPYWKVHAINAAGQTADPAMGAALIPFMRQYIDQRYESPLTDSSRFGGPSDAEVAVAALSALPNLRYQGQQNSRKRP